MTRLEVNQTETSPKSVNENEVKEVTEVAEEDIDEIFDEVSTNEMQGSSILSMEAL